jgi:type IV secretory pathway VirB2 component (pilin)
VDLEAIADGIKLLATLAGVVVVSYSGLMLMASQDPLIRNQWKEIILVVVVGICIVYLAPSLASVFSGGSYCG